MKIQRRAFSLIELLIVILIIALVVAIVLPALGHTRTLARKAATTNLMNNVSQACATFQLDNRRLPGYFTPKEMGDNQNAGRGFSAMENVMFDLAGGVPTDPTAAAYYGPTTGHMVAYDANLVGVETPGTKSYFAPPEKYFKFQDSSGHGSLSGLGDKTATEARHRTDVKDLIDAEGTPLLFWAQDPMAIQPITKDPTPAASQLFARNDSNTAPARFYWNSNAAFLSGTAVGDKRKDQAANSLLGSSFTNHEKTLVAMLGNPNAPTFVPPPSNTPHDDCLPTSARGQFIIHSAGADGIYLGKNDKGATAAVGTGAGQTLNFYSSFRSLPSVDLMKDFDDVIIAGGG